MMRDFWKSAGMHLCTVNRNGWLDVTPDFLRAYYTRPEVHPVEDPWLGARGVLLAGPEGPGLAILEPRTEGLLAALLARRGEGPCAAWLTGVGGPAAGRVRITALGPARVLYAGGRWGPFLLGLDGDPVGPSGATIRG